MARNPTELRATATAFAYHEGAIWGAFRGPTIPMLVETVIGAASLIIALLVSPETRGTAIAPDLVVA